MSPETPCGDPRLSRKVRLSINLFLGVLFILISGLGIIYWYGMDHLHFTAVTKGTDENGSANVCMRLARYEGRMDSYEIPTHWDGKEVCEIGPEAFKGNDTLEKIVVPDTVTTIHREAFASMDNLGEVELNEGLRFIREGAFKGPNNLESIVIPGTVNHLVRPDLFHGAEALKEIILEPGVMMIGEHAFAGAPNLEDIYLPYTLENMRDIFGGYDGFEDQLTFTLEQEPYLIDNAQDPSDEDETLQYMYYLEYDSEDDIYTYQGIPTELVDQHSYEDFKYLLTQDNEAVIIGTFLDHKDSLTLPSEVDGHEVVAVSGGAFLHKTIEEIHVPSTVHIINHQAFQSNNIDRVYVSEDIAYIDSMSRVPIRKID